MGKMFEDKRKKEKRVIVQIRRKREKTRRINEIVRIYRWNVNDERVGDA